MSPLSNARDSRQNPVDVAIKNPPEEAEQAALPEAGDGVSGGVTG
jgi:hypothetical protein